MAHEHDHAGDPSDPGDAEVCVCFHVKRRKIEAFCRREKPKVISLVSQCLSAGTGCGWCIPFLKAIRDEVCAGGEHVDLPSRAEYLAKRRQYHREIGYAKAEKAEEE
jgi:NAD(P)H-nitrite reductase large subunit